MAALTTAQRKKLPRSYFGLPGRVDKNGENKSGEGAYPMPDRKHAILAKGFAAREEKAGRLSAANKAKIDAKADRIIKRTAPRVESTGSDKLPAWTASRERKFQRDRHAKR